MGAVIGLDAMSRPVVWPANCMSLRFCGFYLDAWGTPAWVLPTFGPFSASATAPVARTANRTSRIAAVRFIAFPPTLSLVAKRIPIGKRLHSRSPKWSLQ